MDYELDINVDESALDVELLEQPHLIMKYGAVVADAKKELDYFKELLDNTKAELSKEIRADPDAFDLLKITEAVVADTIIMQDTYKQAAEDVIEAQYRYNMARTAFDAIYARKDVLDGLIKLHGMQYFSGPSVPRNITEEREKRNKATNVQVAKATKKRKVRKDA
jgi:hypothetical protein